MGDLFWITILIATVFVAVYLLRRRLAGAQHKLELAIQILENNTKTVVYEARNELKTLFEGIEKHAKPDTREIPLDPDPEKTRWAIAREDSRRIGSQPFLAMRTDGTPNPAVAQDSMKGIWQGTFTAARTFAEGFNTADTQSGRFFYPVPINDGWVYGKVRPTTATLTASAATVTEAIRNFPGVPELRDRARKNAVQVTAKQIAEAVAAWNQKWKARWRIQEWDAKYYVAKKEDALAAIRLAGAQDVVYIPEFGDCNHFAKRSSGIVDTMMADPADNFGLGGTFGVVDDYGAGHSFLLVIVHIGFDTAGQPELYPMMVEPQSGKEVQPSQDSKSIYFVDGGGVVFFY